MNFDLWGLESSFYLGFPVRLSGVLLLILDLITLAFLLVTDRKAVRETTKPGIKKRFLFYIVLIFGLLVPQILVFRLPSVSVAASETVGLPPEIFFSLLGALPWMLAAGMFGVREAVVVGFISGLVRGGWGTASILTPFNMALQAGLAAVLIRQNYREWPAQIARHPFIAGMASALFFTLLRSVEIFSQTGGEIFDGLSNAISYAPLILVSTGFEAGLAGLVCELIAERWPARWYFPRVTEASPYNRSLARQMISGFVLMGFAAGGGLLYGDWLMADRYAREVITDQMELTAAQIGDSVPYFIQTGRSLVRQYAGEISSEMQEDRAVDDLLSRQLRLVPFFSQIAVYDSSGIQIAVSGGGYEAAGGREIEQGLAAALEGMPQELTIPPESSGSMPVMVFLAPVAARDGSEGHVLAGWTDLTANPMLLPVVSRLESLEQLQAYVTDESGRVLLHPDGEEFETGFLPADLEDGQAVQGSGSDGVRRLIFAHSVEGYPWRVIITVPKANVDQLAIRIAVRLAGVMLVVGVVVVGLVYLVSTRLTRPIRQMAHVAERISQGDLEHPVQSSGDDEIGRLSETFESMRVALRLRLAEMNLLLSVSQKMAASFDLSRVLPAILQELHDVVRADEIRFVLAPDRGNHEGHLECYQSTGVETDWFGLDAEILELGQQSGFFILENPARARTVLSLHKLTIPLNSIAAVPLRDEGHYIGVLWLGYQDAHAFTTDEVNILKILAAHLGVAISNTRLYHRAEQERSRLVAILEATPDAVIVVDGDGIIVLANPAAEQLFQKQSSEMQGRKAEEVIPSPDLIDLLLYSRQEHSTEVHLHKDSVMHAVVSDVVDRGLRSGKVCVLSDITHFKKIEALKTEFVSTVSHDLKSPLNLMNGYATMVGMVGDLNEQQSDYVTRIQTSIGSMTRLVDNLLDLRRIEAGVGLKVEKVDIGEVIEEVIHQHRPQAVNRQLSLRVEIQPDIKPVQADPLLLRQAFFNLLDNAIRYTRPKGSVTIHAEQSEGRCLIKFQDTGVGIAPADQARLFEKFQSTHAGDGTGKEGPGIGLAIVKSIIEQHGGKISVESRLGQGSTFIVELPM